MSIAPRSQLGAEANKIKANFDAIYTQPDPREYYRVLYGLDYIIPELAKPVFRNIIDALEEKKGRPVRVLDLGCSYGNNAALIQFPLDIDRLARRYLDLQLEGVNSAELIMLDRSYFRSWPRRDVEIIGCDLSKPAVDYARSVGLISHGISGNFEIGSMSDKDKEVLRGVDLVISTGSIGYITERTLRQVLAAIGNPAPWVASFVLRMFPYDKVEAELLQSGLETEKLNGVTFVQRRFQSESECVQVLDRLQALGIDPDRKEASGLFHAEFFLSRSAADREQTPIETLAAVSQGTSRTFGRRYRTRTDGQISLMR